MFKKKNGKTLIPDQLFAKPLKLVEEFMFCHNAFDFKYIKRLLVLYTYEKDYTSFLPCLDEIKSIICNPVNVRRASSIHY